MKQIFKNIVLMLCITICVLFIDNTAACAKRHEAKLLIPKNISSFAESQKSKIVNELKEDGVISNCENISYGSPYIIYSPSMKQEAIYYYPLVQSGKIISMLTVLDTNEGLVIQCDDDYIEQLNKINYLHANFVLYEYDNCLYAENEKQKICLQTYGEKKSYRQSERKKELKFFSNTYQKKLEKINKKIKKLIKCVCSVEPDEQNLDELIKSTLKLENPKGQYGYSMCWASAVATIVNYKQGTGVTPFEVCNKMGISYNAGGTIYDEKNALSRYGISYGKVRNRMLSWPEVQNNIKGKNPIIANLKCNDGVLDAHAVTIFGYTSAKKIKYWDSNLKNGNGGERTILYSKASTNFLAIRNHSYSWMTTLSAK